jgi:hypothetical protein
MARPAATADGAVAVELARRLRIFSRKRLVHSSRSARGDSRLRQQSMNNPRVGKINGAANNSRRLKCVNRQRQNFQVGLQTGMAIDFGAKLQRLSAGLRAGGQGVQYGPQ